jgi:SAM-dependent methyltransferase
MFHVVEHLPFGVLADVIRECARVLVPGGLFIAETPNALNLRVAATNFWLDPTHVRPLHPELLRLLADRGGFARTQDLFINEIGTPLELTARCAADEWIQELSRSLDGPGDYALLAWTPSAGSD